jgi:dipeptide/tripeptide permease
MQIILWAIAIYCAVKFLLFSGYALEGLQYYVKSRRLSKVLLTIMYLGFIVSLYSLTLDYVHEEDSENLSLHFWLLFALKFGGYAFGLWWFYFIGKLVLWEEDKRFRKSKND